MQPAALWQPLSAFGGAGGCWGGLAASSVLGRVARRGTGRQRGYPSREQADLTVDAAGFSTSLLRGFLCAKGNDEDEAASAPRRTAGGAEGR